MADDGTKPRAISFSQITTYGDCGFKYRMLYPERKPRSPSGWFIGGNAVHKAIEYAETNELHGVPLWRHEKGVDWIAKEAKRLFDEELARVGGPSLVSWGGRKSKQFSGGEDARWWAFRLPGMVRQYVALRALDELEGRRVLGGGVEMAVTVATPFGREFTARLDKFLFEADDTPLIRDYKTGQVGRANRWQLVLYGWVVAQDQGLDVFDGEYAYLRNPGPPREHVDLRPLLPFSEEFIRKAIVGIENEIFPPEPGWYCKTCDVAAFCPYGATLLDLKKDDDGTKEASDGGDERKGADLGRG